ncbi:MAG TPA: YihY/virulence factor BrkB family protein [Candidatus Faecousia intestinigallinarum]|nr:YihY/virulence factor BrkB family protein [Candidatus Faecousia intestinigallinarum]
MKKYSPKYLAHRGLHAMNAIARLHIPLHAANAGYFIVLAIFPALVLLLSLLRFTPLQVEDLTDLLRGFLPDALMPTAERLIISTYANTSTAMVGFSALTALWSSSRGIYGLLTGLNAIYGVSEDRSFLYTRLISVLYTFLFILVLLLTLALHVFGTIITDFLAMSPNPFLRFLADILNMRFFLLLFVQTTLFTAMFMVFPNRRNRLWDSLPGALLAAIGWQIFSQLFSVYMEYFPSYSNIYGSVYAIALSMLWLYFCLSIVFYGGVLNAYLMRREDSGK